MAEDRDKDKSIKIVSPQSTGKTATFVSLDVVKSAYIAESLSVKAIAERYFIPESQVQKIVDDHKLHDLRKAYILQGVSKLQNQQLGQAQKLLDVELKFKELRLAQLEKVLNDFLAYFGRHGDFYKRHPITGEILHDTDGIPMQVHVPNVSREIAQLKESVGLSESLKTIFADFESLIRDKPNGEAVGDGEGEVVDLNGYGELFKSKKV